MADGSIKGLDGLQAKLSALPSQLDKATKASLFLSGLKVEELAKKSITGGGKTGRIYRKGKNGSILHQASAPGEAPASDTGRLVNSINTTATPEGEVVRIAAGGGIVNYARALEFGTRDMAPRPYMGPALKEATPFIEQTMKRSLKDVTDNISKK